MNIIITGLLLSLTYFLVGAVWYSSFLFGSAWKKEIDLHQKSTKNVNILFVMGASFACMLILVFSILSCGEFLPVDAWLGKKAKRFLIVIPIIISASTVNHLYEGKSLKLWLINTGYMVLGLSIVSFLCHFLV